MRKTKPELESEKKLVAETVARWVHGRVRIGIGSGTTSAHFIRALGRRVREERLAIEGIATSRASEELARTEGIPLLTPAHGLLLDFTVDGADELTPELHLIKGGGGKLFREKVIATASRFLLVIADSSKPVPVLGATPLPIEIVPFALPWVEDRISSLGAATALRRIAGVPYLTDQNNWILDCKFHSIPDPLNLASQLESIPGILEHGLFLGLAKFAVVADGRDVSILRPNRAPENAASLASMPPLP